MKLIKRRDSVSCQIYNKYSNVLNTVKNNKLIYVGNINKSINIQFKFVENCWNINIWFRIVGVNVGFNANCTSPNLSSCITTSITRIVAIVANPRSLFRECNIYSFVVAT